MANLTNKLTELSETIAELKTKSTQLHTQLESVEEQLREQGINNPNDASKVLKKGLKEIDELDSKITDLIDNINNILDGKTE